MVKRVTEQKVREFFPAHGYLAASEMDMYKAPSLTQVEITTWICVNKGINTNTVKLYLESEGVSQQFYEQVLEPGERVQGRHPLMLSEGDKLRGEATNAGEVAWLISGIKEYGTQL